MECQNWLSLGIVLFLLKPKICHMVKVSILFNVSSSTHINITQIAMDNNFMYQSFLRVVTWEASTKCFVLVNLISLTYMVVLQGLI